MNKALVFLFFISVIFSSCNRHKKNVNLPYVPSDEAEVTTLAFDASVHSDTNFKRMVLQYYEVNPKAESKLDEDIIKHQKLEFDSVKKRLDTGKIYVFIADTLIRMRKDYLQTAIKFGKNDTVHSNFNKVVDNWASEININESQATFNMKNLAFDYNYEYVLQSRMKPGYDKTFGPGIFRMSAIFFNSTKTKAFVYTEIKNRRGYEMFFIKKNGKWSIAEKHLVWIT